MNLAKQLIGKVKHNKTLRKWALKAYAIKYPPPYRRPNMEFDFDAWSSISAISCWNGRQIGDDNAGPYPYKKNIATKYAICKFRDSREGLPMNVTTLPLIMPIWEDTLQLTTLLRKQYIAHRHLGSERLNLVQAYLFSKFAVSLPAYLTRRKEKPVRDGALQPLETAFYMLGTAPFMLVRKLMVKGDFTPLDPLPMSAQRVYDLADTSGVLISPLRRACPASPQLIREFLDVMMNGKFIKSLDSTEAQRVLNTLGDWNRFYNYAHAASRLELLIRLNQALSAHALLTLLTSDMAIKTSHENIMQTVLQTILSRLYMKMAPLNEAYTILGNMTKVLLALLRDHGDDISLDKLNAAGCLETNVLQTIASPRNIARRIYLGSSLIYEASRRDLLIVHQALGRSNWRCITEYDLLQRTGGPELPKLLTQIVNQRAKLTRNPG